VEIVLQIRKDLLGVIGRKPRPFGDRRVEVHETLRVDVGLVSAVAALTRSTVHERVVRADERVVTPPLRRVVRYVA